jgi:HSP20 family protein
MQGGMGMALFDKWNPTRDLHRFRRELDDFLEKFGVEGGVFKDWEQSTHPACESYVDGDKFIVRVDLPGIDPANIDVKVVGGTLTIKGSRKEKAETSKQDYLRREIRYGSFERSISLPDGVKAEDLKASYRNGVLELTALMPKESAPKEVKIDIEDTQSKK